MQAGGQKLDGVSRSLWSFEGEFHPSAAQNVNGRSRHALVKHGLSRLELVQGAHFGKRSPFRFFQEAESRPFLAAAVITVMFHRPDPQ